jgi:beta-glucosidase/6-phospho-beta-glucosidase/beta-galactosidase
VAPVMSLLPSTAGLASFILAGFESSAHRRRDGRRLDLTASTLHDRFCDQDYARMSAEGILVARESVRWPVVEPRPGEYDFGPLLPVVNAAEQHGVQVIWDLCHFGWPDDLDPFEPRFAQRLAALTRAFTVFRASRSDGPPYLVPVNEISFMAWVGGDHGFMNPFAVGRGGELKRALVRASIAACEAAIEVDASARFVIVDPLIRVFPASEDPEVVRAAAGHDAAQYEAWDLLSGRREPELGGNPRYLDIVGVNYYLHNQWEEPGEMLAPSDPRRRPLRELLTAVWERYRRPVVITETGVEDDDRAPWFRAVAEEVMAARASGVPVEGICLYPILNHPGWDDDRHCHNGLWDYADEVTGEREGYGPLLEEVREVVRRTSPPTSREGRLPGAPG